MVPDQAILTASNVGNAVMLVYDVCVSIFFNRFIRRQTFLPLSLYVALSSFYLLTLAVLLLSFSSSVFFCSELLLSPTTSVRFCVSEFLLSSLSYPLHLSVFFCPFLSTFSCEHDHVKCLTSNLRLCWEN